MKKSLLITAIASAAAFATMGVQADIVGSQSSVASGTHIEVGESGVPFGPHTAGNAGIGISSYWFGWKVDFEGLLSSSQTTSTTTSGKTVYSLHDPFSTGSTVHSDLGSFNFARAGSSDVWFGEWSTDGASNWTNRQVYYVGENDGTTLPASGTADYSVVGINKFDGSNLLTGTLTADFTAATLTGDLTRSGLTVDIEAVIDSTDASFAGDATANGAAGVSEGHFFGAGAAELAGIATFANADLNTAFGGTKD